MSSLISALRNQFSDVKLSKDEYRHGILFNDKTKKYQSGIWIGPGTNLLKKAKMVQNNDLKLEEIPYTDLVAAKHDIQYSKAQNMKQIKLGDQKMLENLTRGYEQKLDNNFNLNQGFYPIKFKSIIEKIIPITNKITNYGDYHDLKQEDKDSIDFLQQKLELEYGLGLLQNDIIDLVKNDANINILYSQKQIYDMQQDLKYKLSQKYYM